jgi:thiamine-phosphate pyrophosphorylase
MVSLKLIAITTETFFESEAETVNLLFENGLEVLHLRKPYASQEEMDVFIKQINADFHSRIVVHDHHDLAESYDLKGIHFNRRNRVDKGTRFSERRLSVSCSCHSLEEVTESSFCDYVFLSPIFDSLSKMGYKQAFMPQQLLEAKERKIIDEKVIALGGITTKNIPEVRRYGFGGVAVLGALWGDFATDGDVSELLKRFDELKMECETI